MSVNPEFLRTTLYRRATLQALERAAQAQLPAHSLMQRAGLALFHFLCTQFPTAKRMWFICGAGNNGGDAMVAARLWQQEQRSGPCVAYVTAVGTPQAGTDAAWAAAQAAASGLQFCQAPPQQPDVIVDGLWGLGFHARPAHDRPDKQPPNPLLEPILQHLHHLALARRAGDSTAAPIVAVDIPSGIDAESGLALHPYAVRADYTLAMLAHKPGTFMSDGLDHAGHVHLATLDIETLPAPFTLPKADATLHTEPPAPLQARARNSHKGLFGDVVVIGGAAGMAGALLLASSSALCGGAGRVFAISADPQATTLYASWPEIMLRPSPWLASMPAAQTPQAALDWTNATVLMGCGAGVSPHSVAALAELIPAAARLILDADALNCIAQTPELEMQLQRRAQGHPGQLIITPHPLEAARLLHSDVATVQADRLHAAQQLATRWQAVCILKGAGTVIACPDNTLHVWPVGNAKLAQAGSGDVLAGYCAAVWAECQDAALAAAWAVYAHGSVAEHWPHPTMRAQELAQALGRFQRWIL